MAGDGRGHPAGPEDGLSELKTQFLASLNHEVRTPLTGILGMTDLLLETSLDPEQKDYVSAIRTCAGELLVLFDKTLEYSDLSCGRVTLTRREFHLQESLRGAVRGNLAGARAKGLQLRLRMASGLPPVAIGDGPRLQRLLGHLVENAVKFTDRGRVVVGARGRAAGNRLELHIEVRDTGIGIAPESLPLAFQTFRQLDSGPARGYNGLGLGLSLVLGLTELMGGVLKVDSTPGCGSTFTVVVPLELPADESLRAAS
ncbi:MAG: hypothetical protein IT159_10995 [Bryobacterales bacterium]|nr:hypothetical protein [Bryobacterales bacterium]